jgi:hypothetical protein
VIPHFDSNQREFAVREVLRRHDLQDGSELATAIGGMLGEYAIFADRSGKRTDLIPLVEEVLANPRCFALLESDASLCAFLDRFAFRMKEQVSKQLDRVELASDFARWCTVAWRHVAIVQSDDENDTTSVAQFAWCPVALPLEPMPTCEQRAPWWAALRSLAGLIVRQEPARDIVNLMRHMRHGGLVELVSTDDVLSWVGTICDRLAQMLSARSISLASYGPNDRAPARWRETLDCSVAAIEELWAQGRLADSAQAEGAFGLLTRLTGTPFSQERAKAALHRLNRG